jgi:hypothetical protein
MSARSIVGFSVLICLGSGAPVLTKAQSAGDDLKATIVLHGFPCDRVIDSKRNADSDYTATCKDGNRYHIIVDASGHVVVKKL